MNAPQSTEVVPEVIPWERFQKEAEKGLPIDAYIMSMNAHILNQRDTIKRLAAREKDLRDVLKDIAFGARMMIESPAITPPLKRYAEEVKRVAEGNLTALQESQK